MTVTLDLEPGLDDQLRASAEAEGMSVETYLRQLIAKAVHRTPSEPVLALLQRWEKEDATGDASELARREREWEAFRESMNRSHSSTRVLFP